MRICVHMCICFPTILYVCVCVCVLFCGCPLDEAVCLLLSLKPIFHPHLSCNEDPSNQTLLIYNHLSIKPIYPFIYLSNHSFHLFIYPSNLFIKTIYFSIYSSIYLSNKSIHMSNQTIHFSIYRTNQLSFYLSINSSLHISIHLSIKPIYPSNYLSTHLSIHQTNLSNQYTYFSIYPLIHQSIY